jgi:hypothetical protein
MSWSLSPRFIFVSFIPMDVSSQIVGNAGFSSVILGMMALFGVWRS